MPIYKKHGKQINARNKLTDERTDKRTDGRMYDGQPGGQADRQTDKYPRKNTIKSADVADIRTNN